jgi:hypothetical protein
MNATTTEKLTQTAHVTSTGSAQTEQPQGKLAQGRRRNASRKQRPTDVPGLIAALNDGALDQRHAAARDVLMVREALGSQPRPVAIAIVRQALALDAVVMQRIQAEVLKPDNSIVDANGNLHPLLVQHWPDVRAGIMRGAKSLMELDKKAAAAGTAAGGNSLDISSIILLEAQNDADTD